MANIVLAIICFVLECIVFIFVVVATPLDILRVKKTSQATFDVAFPVVPAGQVNTKRTCFSAWGIKRCGPHKTNPEKLPYKGFPTKKVSQIAKAACAFDIISIFFTLVCLILTALVMGKCLGSLPAMILAIVCVITIIISIGCQLGAYYHHIGALGKVKDHVNLYAGVALIVCGWCLQVIELVLIIICTACC